MNVPVTPRLFLNLKLQRLGLRCDAQAPRYYRVSTARSGAGERLNSGCTPRGLHEVVEKFGAGCPPGTVFVARRASGELYSPALAARYPRRDWILTRILRLRGCEPGRNLGDEVDSYRRCIYLHGVPDDSPMGMPGSKGCIRMTNADVVELFDRVPVGTPLLIEES